MFQTLITVTALLVGQATYANVSVRAIAASYEYEEPGLMEIYGGLSGVGMQLKKDTENSQFGLVDLQYLSGGTTYKGTYMSGGTTPRIKNNDYTYTLRASYGGYLTEVGDNAADISVGVAHRYQKNNNKSRDREQTYFYLPVELGVNLTGLGDTTFRLSYEHDVFISGRNETHWEQVQSDLENVKYEQSKGSGNRVALSMNTPIDDLNLLAQLHVQRWKVEDSSVETLRFKDGAIATANGYPIRLQEPKNETKIVGFSLGLQF